MKNLCATMGIAVLCSTAAAMAQSSTDKGQMAKDNDKKMKDGMVMVTGCVAQGADAKHYMLNNAMMSPMAMDKMSADPATKPESSKPMSADQPMMSYMLDGGDVKAHLGHKVEVSGTIEKSAMGKMDGGKTGTTDKDKMGDKDKIGTTGTTDKDKMSMDHKDMAGGTLKVKSVKMLSASCQ